MSVRLRVGTRRSALARAQTDQVIRALARDRAGATFVATTFDTSGDRDRRPGAPADFTDTIDRALQRGDVDLAVHSAKDLPLTLAEGLELAACPFRADPRDCLVVRRTADARVLPKDARVGSSSPRRRAQLLRWRPDLQVVEIRGNVDSRLERVRRGDVDAAVLAVAGLTRLRQGRAIGRILPTREFVPAPAQGAIAVVVRHGDRRTAELVGAVDRPGVHAEVVAERAFGLAMGGDCETPLGACARARRGRLTLLGEVLEPRGRARLRGRTAGATTEAERLGRRLGETLLDRGADVLLGRPAP